VHLEQFFFSTSAAIIADPVDREMCLGCASIDRLAPCLNVSAHLIFGKLFARVVTAFALNGTHSAALRDLSYECDWLHDALRCSFQRVMAKL
jgi:hypothetical protein